MVGAHGAPDGLDPASNGARPRFDSLARNLEALSSPTRLEILHALRTPRPLHEIRVRPSAVLPGENAERPLARQAVAKHLDFLGDVGLVSRTEEGASVRGDAYVLNHERLFAIVDEVRNLAKLRPALLEPPVPGETTERALGPEAHLPPRPRLVVAYGRDDGVAFALPADRAEARIGRDPTSDVVLDYDPYVSASHSAVRRLPDGAGFVLVDLDSRNGTWVNWSRLPRGGRERLRFKRTNRSSGTRDSRCFFGRLGLNRRGRSRRLRFKRNSRRRHHWRHYLHDRRTRRISGRIDQRSVFAHQMSLRPAQFNQQIDERLVDRTRRNDLDVRPAVRATFDAQAHADQRRAVLDVGLCERLGCSDAHLERSELVLLHRHEIDFRQKRLAQHGHNSEFAQPGGVSNAGQHQ